MDKRIKIIKAMLHDNRTEWQGIAESSEETAKEFVEGAFGQNSCLTGEYRENCIYLYSFTEPLTDIMPDAVVTDTFSNKVYLYCLD